MPILMPGQAKPLRRPAIVCKKLGSETMLYDQTRGSFHILNATALLVWELCDGNHSLNDMEVLLRDRFSVSNGEDVAADINAVICRLTDEGLLESVT